jgi:hypothetical protein
MDLVMNHSFLLNLQSLNSDAICYLSPKFEVVLDPQPYVEDIPYVIQELIYFEDKAEAHYLWLAF